MDPIAVNKTTGGYINPVKIGELPQVKAAYAELLSRVQALPFVPRDWTALVKTAMSGGGSWVPRYAIRADAWRSNQTAPVLSDIPPWLENNEAARVAWNKLTDWWTAKLQPLLAGWARDEQKVMEAANEDAAFFNALYEVVRPVAAVGQAVLDAPEKAGEVVSKSVFSGLKGLLPVILLVGALAVGALVYKKKLTGK